MRVEAGERIKVYIAGAGGSYPPPGYAGPCILLEAGANKLLVDPGEGCLSRLLEAGVHPCSLDLVYVSHRHIDHWAGLPSIAVARSVEGCPSLRVWAPAGGENAHPFQAFTPSSVAVEVATPKLINLGPLTLEAVPVSHVVPTMGLLARTPLGSLFYTADTEPGPWIERVRGVDLLLGEATLPSGASVEGHMSVGQLLESARRIGARLLVPLHLSPYSLRELEGTVESGGVVGGLRVVYGEKFSVYLPLRPGED